ncbi:hypothetical protein Q1695_011676 [Nippostrongylus brasiliensis]|nr:hypothetical protein Q1695_011674 [Nippostrongylus brasiliensis]WKX94583.1 hypothetical protein Q1695_011676 [Nippostrongylus brasiliensis]
MVIAVTADPNVYQCSGLGMTPEERQSVLTMYNIARGKTATGTYFRTGTKLPTAKNMRALTWDCELEKLAEKSALTCDDRPLPVPYYAYNFRFMLASIPNKLSALEPAVQPTEDPSGGFTTQSSSVVYNGNPIYKNYANALKTWWNQRKLVDDQVKKVLFENAFIQPAVMEFVQMATGQNSLVGCAADKRGNQYNVVCQYHVGIGAPTPEESFMPLYFIGKPCLAPCDDNRKCSKGMCPSLSSRSYRIFTNFSPTDFFD